MIASLLQVPINQLFIPRPPLPFWPGLTDRSIELKKSIHIDPALPFMQHFENADLNKEIGEIVESDIAESPRDRKERKKIEKQRKNLEYLRDQSEKWNPATDPKINIAADPFKTIIVARLNYDTSEKRLAREFERFGPISSIRLIRDILTGKSRGYAFIEYEREKDAKIAYREGNGMKIDERRVCVDVERGRTVKGWKPRRLGGGLGNTRSSNSEITAGLSGRETPQNPIVGREEPRKRNYAYPEPRDSSTYKHYK